MPQVAGVIDGNGVSLEGCNGDIPAGENVAVVNYSGWSDGKGRAEPGGYR